VEVFTSELPAFDLNLSHQFYQELLGPLDDSLNGIGNLVMVPSGALLSLPPALLLRRAPAGAGDYRNAPWLVRDMAMSILPSITSLSQLRQDIKPSRAGRPFIGFGDPNFTGNAAERGGEALNQLERECQGSNDQVDPAMVRALGELPETADELYALANVLGAPRDAVHLRNQAQVSDVLAANLQDYRVIAFATHALLPGEVDCLPEPALALTPPAQPDAEEDGLLAASDVAGLQLDADWVLLSACNTGGRGGELGGESLSGLATAFFYAGARAMLVTHWAVFSEPTVTLTTGTFRRFTSAPGRGRAEALRQAQLSMVDNPETSHPVFWAAFTLVGNDVSL
jgi:CHAT domain-containing protein